MKCPPTRLQGIAFSFGLTIIRTRHTSTFAKGACEAGGTFPRSDAQILENSPRHNFGNNVRFCCNTEPPFGEAGMRTGNGKVQAKHRPLRATGLRFEKDRLVLLLDDQREISLPLSKYPTLQAASSSQRRAWEIIGDGDGFHWEALDLDLSTLGLANGYPERIPKPPVLTKRVRPAHVPK